MKHLANTAGSKKATWSSKLLLKIKGFYRIYILNGLDGIGKHNKQQIDCEFNDQSFDLRIIGFNGKNWRLKFPQLNGLIDPAACKLKVKSNSITIELKKAKSKHWDDIKVSKKADKEKSSIAGKKGEEKDPSTALMDMMKNLYDNGDDQMKKTIAESWSKT